MPSEMKIKQYSKSYIGTDLRTNQVTYFKSILQYSLTND